MGITETVRQVEPTERVLVPCPACGRAFAWPPTGSCEGCAADLAGPVAASIFAIDRDVAALHARREAAVESLRADAVAARRELAPPEGTPAAIARPRTSSVRPQVILAGAGAMLLLAAGVVFIAVTWPTWPASAQAAFVALLTGAGAVGARAAARRSLPVTADAVGVVTIGIPAYALLEAQREGLLGLGGVDPVLWFALVAAAAAVAAAPFTVWAGLRDTLRRLGALAAVAAGIAGMVALTRLVDATDPSVLLVGAAPAVAVVLLVHARWVLRADDPFRHATRVTPVLLAAGAAVGTGLLALDRASVAAVAIAAGVGLPVLVRLRQSRPTGRWTAVGAVITVVWVVQLVTFLLTDATAELTGPAAPRLVTAAVAAALLGGTARWRPPARPWRDPALVGSSLVLLPAGLWTIGVWAAKVEIVAGVLTSPFTGWPAAAALTTTDLVLAITGVVGVALATARLRPGLTRGVLLLGGGAVAAVAVVAGAAAEVVAIPVPALLAVGAAVVASVVWARDPSRWVPVACTEVAALGLALVDLDLFAAVAAGVAIHLLVVAAQRRDEVTAALGVAAGLVAVAATGAAVDLATGTTTLVVTVVAGTVMVWSQFAAVCRPWHALPTDVVVALGATIATGTALVQIGAVPSVAVQFAVVAVVAAVHAARPGRGWVVWLSSVAVSASIWTLLADRGVDVVEAYTLPAAVALAVAGWWRLRTTTASSWTALWPACAMASLPTLAVLLDGPDPLRVLLLTSGAVSVALVGHWRRLAAPLSLGAAVAVVTALLQLWDWSADLPRWVTFGTLGAALIWTSATYEAQLRRARQIRNRLADLR